MLQSIVPPKNASAAAAAPAPATSATLINITDGVLTLTLNRPDRYNAFNFPMYSEVQAALNDAASRSDVRAMVVTGAGKYYSSGNDLANFMTIPPEGPAKMAADAAAVLEAFVNAHIRFTKPLIAAVNGPAIGIPGMSIVRECLLLRATGTICFLHMPYGESIGYWRFACA